MTDPVITENKLFHWIAAGIGTFIASMLIWFAYTVSQTSNTLNVMAEHVSNIDKKIDDGFVELGRRIDDHESRLRCLESAHPESCK